MLTIEGDLAFKLAPQTEGKGIHRRNVVAAVAQPSQVYKSKFKRKHTNFQYQCANAITLYVFML